MAAKVSVSKRRASKDDEPELEGLSAPASPQIQIQDGQQLQMPQAPAQSKVDLSRHEIRDRVAMGGMSQLELQNMIRSNVFLTDEDIAAWTGKGGGSRITPAQSIAAPPENVFGSGRGGPNPHTGPTPHGGPIGGHDALGFENALAPQGILAPQGFMTKVGMLGFVKGLMGIRSDGAKPGAMTPKQNSNQSQSKQAPQQRPQQTPQAQASSSKAPPQGREPLSSAARASALSTQQQAQQATTQSMSQSQASQARPSDAFQPVQSQMDASQAFQPVQPEGNNWIRNAMWGNNRSPFVEILNRFFSLLKSLFSGSEQLPPHMRGGGKH